MFWFWNMLYYHWFCFFCDLGRIIRAPIRMIAVQILKLRNRKFPDYLFDRKNNRNFDNWTDGGIGSVFYGELVFWRSQSYMVILSTELLIMGALGIDFLKQVDWFSITILIIPPFILGWIVDKLLLRTCS